MLLCGQKAATEAARSYFFLRPWLLLTMPLKRRKGKLLWEWDGEKEEAQWDFLISGFLAGKLKTGGVAYEI